MAIVNFKPTHRKKHYDRVRTTDDDYVTTTGALSDCTQSSVDGITDTIPMVVDIYRSQMGTDDKLHHADIGLDPVYQNYLVTRGYTLRVTQPLEEENDPDNMTTNTIGRALLPASMKANVGDVIVIKDGIPWLLCRITEVQATAWGEDPMYEIVYMVTGVTHENEDSYVDLEDKTNEEQVWNDAIGGPLPVAQQANLDDVFSTRCALTEAYMANFVNKDSELLLFKKDGLSIYDPNLARFVQNTSRTKAYDHNCDYRVINIDQQSHWITIFDKMLRPRLDILNTYKTELKFYTKGNMSGNVTVANALHAPITHMLEANDSLAKAAGETLASILPTTGVTYDATPRVIFPVHKDDAYVFTTAFYSGVRDDMSLLEVLIDKFVKREPLVSSDLDPIFQDYKNWEDLERFYYTPFLLAICSYVIGDS